MIMNDLLNLLSGQGIIVIAIGIIVLLVFSGFRVAQEYQRAIIFMLGRYVRTGGPGIFWVMPFFQSSRILDIRTVTVAIEPQETITRDSVTIKVNAVLWYKIVSPSKAIIQVADYRPAVNQAALTSLRNIIGQHNLDEILQDRDRINEAVRAIVDRMTEPWGVQIEAVEMKDVEIPVSMQRAMAQEAEATREKRARIIKAQAEQEASEKLALAALEIARNPVALELRRMQMVAEVGAEHNTTTIIMMPAEFLQLARNLNENMGKVAPHQQPTPQPPAPRPN
jgi:regulator of protease activity HflC (stomatin/prohibitin superfamily)